MPGGAAPAAIVPALGGRRSDGEPSAAGRRLNASNRMRARIRIVILLIASSAIRIASGSAQPLDRPGFKSAATPPSPAQSVAKLLDSTDPREQAWGAWYAGRDAMPQFVPLLERVAMEHAGGGSLAGEAALDAAVDSLIQLHAKVPEQLIRLIHARRDVACRLVAGSDRATHRACRLGQLTN
jgi:hypothetical protein